MAPAILSPVSFRGYTLRMDDLHGRVALVTGASRGIMIQAVLPGMRARQWGRIVNLLSVAAQVGGVVDPHYVNGGWFMS